MDSSDQPETPRGVLHPLRDGESVAFVEPAPWSAPEDDHTLGVGHSGDTRTGGGASSPGPSRQDYNSKRQAAETPRQNSPRRAYDLLRAGIRSGVIATDQPLDESLIAQRFGTSRNSVRQALQMLAAEGLVTRQTRLGTSVSGKIAELPIVNIGIASVASAHDQNYEGITHEIIDLQYIPAPALIQNRLATTDEEVLLVESLLSLKSTPLYVTVGYICVGECSRQVLVDRVRELYRSPQDLDSSMLLLYGKHFGHARTSIEATACDARTARLLGVAEGAPILFRDRVLYDEDGQPRDLSYSHLRGDRTALTAEFFRATG